MVSSVGVLVLLAALSFASADFCPANSEFTTSAECDIICGVPCDYKGIKNFCLCSLGYMKDPKTQECVPESQCSISADVPVLRNAPPFAFSCFT